MFDFEYRHKQIEGKRKKEADTEEQERRERGPTSRRSKYSLQKYIYLLTLISGAVDAFHDGFPMQDFRLVDGPEVQEGGVGIVRVGGEFVEETLGGWRGGGAGCRWGWHCCGGG